MADNVVPSQQLSPIARAQRLALGLLTLLLVDVIWVASSELTEYIFKSQNYNKPFFSTYLKTSLFMLYLPGFLIYKPWREQCQVGIQLRRVRDKKRDEGYRAITADSDTDQERSDDMLDCDSEQEEDGMSRSLSEPTFLPIRSSDNKSSAEGTDSEADSGSRKVRFSRVAEVRSMSASEAIHANLARLSYAASLRAAAALQRAANRLTVAETAQLALSFSLLWFAGNYSYQAALAYTEAGIVNVLSASSCLFTLILSAIFPSTQLDKLSLTKVVAVLFTVCGVVLVSYSDLKLEDGFPLGSLWTLSGSIFYSSYIVFLRRKIDHEDKLDVPMFFGFVGLFSFLFLWPLFFVLHFTNHEHFDLPDKQQMIALLINGIVGTVLSELLWLFGCFYTSSLIATLSISLTIPLTTFADVLIKNVEYDQLFYVGSIPMFVSFFIVAMVSHWNNWDPMLEGLTGAMQKCRNCLCPSREVRRRIIAESLENECLIEAEEQENHTNQDTSSHCDAA